VGYSCLGARARARARRINARGTLRPVAEALSNEDVGWVETGTKTQAPYVWVVRCPEHPPADGSTWEPLSRRECPTEAACEECNEFLV
jgi:hypothetical protein